MKTKKIILLALCFTLYCSAMGRSYNIIPQPKEIIEREGNFLFVDGTMFYATNAEDQKVANFFISKMTVSTGLDISLTSSKKKAQVQLLRNKRIKNQEGYRLTVTKDGVVAEAPSAQGLFYAMQTLMQLLPPQVESMSKVSGIEWSAPAVTINDEPRFEYRSLMLDPCRHFFSIDELKRQLDIMAMYKAKNMHLHLTEDQGWRVEIKKYPRLTEIGATAIGTSKSGDGSLGPSKYFYTQEELKDLVRYAQERFINIIPEFEMPGHELAAIASYPWLSCSGKEVQPRSVWGVESVVICPGKESTFQFLQDVIDELVEIFPSKYFHIGGDESPRTEWRKCPLCQKRADELGLKNEEHRSREAQLQSYVVTRMEKYLNNYGRTIIGWDEILEGGGLNKSAIVMSWRGVNGGISAAKAGHKAIMSPSSNGYYLDYYEGDRALEPVAPTYAPSVPLSETYNYEPIAKELEGEYEKYILGPQGNMWTEYVPTAEIMEFRLYPRALAILETGWSPKTAKNFADFSRRLDHDSYLRLDAKGVKYNIPIPEQPNGSCDYIVFTDNAQLEFKTTRPQKMYYTTDGSEPTQSSTLYTAPININTSTTVKIATILPCGLKSPTRSVVVTKQSLQPAINAAQMPGHGLQIKIAKGLYTSRAALANVERWKTDTISALNNIPRIKTDDNYSAVAEGMVNVPKDGVYLFQSNYTEVWIDDNKVVDNTNNWVLDGNRGGRSAALAAGLHRIKVVFLGYLPDGRPTYWDSGKITWRMDDASRFSEISPDHLYLPLE